MYLKFTQINYIQIVCCAELLAAYVVWFIITRSAKYREKLRCLSLCGGFADNQFSTCSNWKPQSPEPREHPSFCTCAYRHQPVVAIATTQRASPDGFSGSVVQNVFQPFKTNNTISVEFERCLRSGGFFMRALLFVGGKLFIAGLIEWITVLWVKIHDFQIDLYDRYIISVNLVFG